MEAEVIVAYGSLVTAIGGIVIAIFTSRNSARKVELQQLRDEVSSLKRENSKLKRKILCLEKTLRDGNSQKIM